MLLGIRMDQGRSGGIALCHYEVWSWELETNHVIKAATRENGFTNRVSGAAYDRTAVVEG